MADVSDERGRRRAARKPGAAGQGGGMREDGDRTRGGGRRQNGKRANGAGNGAGPAGETVAGQAAAIASAVTEEAERPGRRRRLAAALAGTARSGARVTGRGLRAARRGAGWSSGWLTAQVLAMAPRLKVRDQAELQRQFPGLSREELAGTLIEGASRAAAAVGGAIGAWAVLPAVPAFPVEIAAETLALVGIEIKLVAELHEVYGMPATGSTADRMTAYVGAWAQRRGVGLAPSGLVLAAGSPLARRLRRRLAARATRSAVSLGPLLTGAAAGALANRWETRRLGEDIRADLRRRAADVA
jgi:hypothetical protein